MKKFSTCDFGDQFKDDATGLVRFLPMVFKSFGARTQFGGPVATVKCYEDNSRVKELVESKGENRVLVVDGGGSLRRALLGGNLGAAAAKNGWAGLVIDGALRDVDELMTCDIGILALASMPLPTNRKDQGQSEVVVHIQGVAVRPGDYLYADQDGIVIAPAKLD